MAPVPSPEIRQSQRRPHHATAPKDALILPTLEGKTRPASPMGRRWSEANSRRAGRGPAYGPQRECLVLLRKRR